MDEDFRSQDQQDANAIDIALQLLKTAQELRRIGALLHTKDGRALCEIAVGLAHGAHKHLERFKTPSL